MRQPTRRWRRPWPHAWGVCTLELDSVPRLTRPPDSTTFPGTTRHRYAPVDTASVVQQLAGQTFAAIAAAEGDDSSALAEAQIIEQLCTVGRVVVATNGGGERTEWRGAPRCRR